MKKPSPKHFESLTKKAEARAVELINSKLMAFGATDDSELEQALVDQQIACAMAEAWGELCSEATDKIIEIQPPG
jgi:hypothetical protein